MCGRNEGCAAARRALRPRGAGDAARLHDRVPGLFAGADALVHATAGLTVLEAWAVGCTPISYGWGRGHIRANNRAFVRHGIARRGPKDRDALDGALDGRSRAAAHPPRRSRACRSPPTSCSSRSAPCPPGPGPGRRPLASSPAITSATGLRRRQRRARGHDQRQPERRPPPRPPCSPPTARRAAAGRDHHRDDAPARPARRRDPRRRGCAAARSSRPSARAGRPSAAHPPHRRRRAPAAAADGVGDELQPEAASTSPASRRDTRRRASSRPAQRNGSSTGRPAGREQQRRPRRPGIPHLRRGRHRRRPRRRRRSSPRRHARAARPARAAPWPKHQQQHNPSASVGCTTVSGACASAPI